MAYQGYVKPVQDLGFHRVAIVSRKTYKVEGTSNSSTDIPTAWMDGDKQVNENQELLDNWADVKGTEAEKSGAVTKANLCFFGQKFNIVKRGANGEFIVCSKGKLVCLAQQFNTIWFVVFADCGAETAKFGSARTAFAKIGKIWDPIVEAQL